MSSPASIAEPQLRPANGQGFVRDVATLGVGSVLNAAFGVLQVFLIPRLVSVEDFGYWRLFLLYVGYAGLLHLGFADGALLRWAGKPIESFGGELRPAFRFLLLQQAGIALAGGAVCWFLLHGPVRFIAIAVLSVAVVFNLATLLQFALQASRQFAPLAVATIAPMGTFVVLAFIASRLRVLDFRLVILLYFVSWSAVLLYLWIKTGPGGSTISWRHLGRETLAVGWPVVLANTALGLVVSADRLVVSSAASLYDFAQYSLAASTMFVPLTVIQAISRVAFPHFAAREPEQRPRLYRRASRLLLLCWSLLLPYYIAVDVFVRHFLPKYVPGLPVAAVLLFGVVFFAAIQILQSSLFNLYGRQRTFFVLSLAAMGLSFVLAIVAAVVLHSTLMVAVGQVVAMLIWWQVNELFLRDLTGCGQREWLRTFLMVAWSAASFWVCISFFSAALVQALAYYVLLAIPIAILSRQELRLLGGLATSLYASVTDD